MFEIIIAILVLSALIFVHELGHFVAAKIVGVRVLDFSVGFGRPIYSIRIRGTMFKVGIIPLGGYIRMLNNSNSNEVQGISDAIVRKESYSTKTGWQKVFILVMGPLANIATAFVLFFFLFLLVGSPRQLPVVGSVQVNSFAAEAGVESGDIILLVDNKRVNYLGDINAYLANIKDDTTTIEYFSHGEVKKWQVDISTLNKGTDLAVQLGIEPTYTPVVLRTIDDSPASVAGVSAGDRIVSIDSRVINSWMDVVRSVNNRGGGSNNIDVVVLRDGDYVDIPIELGVVYGEGNTTRPWLGIQATPNYLYIKYGVVESAILSVSRLTKMAVNILGMVWGLVNGSLSLTALGGPLAVITLTADSTAGGAYSTLIFLAYISTNLAILNMLPIPLLDGGNIVGTILAGTTRKYFPNSNTLKVLGNASLYAGVFFLLGLFAFVFINDIRNIL